MLIHNFFGQLFSYSHGRCIISIILIIYCNHNLSIFFFLPLMGKKICQEPLCLAYIHNSHSQLFAFLVSFQVSHITDGKEPMSGFGPVFILVFHHCNVHHWFVYTQCMSLIELQRWIDYLISFGFYFFPSCPSIVYCKKWLEMRGVLQVYGQQLKFQCPHGSRATVYSFSFFFFLTIDRK